MFRVKELLNLFLNIGGMSMKKFAGIWLFNRKLIWGSNNRNY